MDSEKTFESIPDDLFLEIFSRLSSILIARCRCVSKRWASILYRKDFTELFLTKSSARPRLLFAVDKGFQFYFYSSPQSQNQSTLEVDFHTNVGVGINENLCSYESGLIHVHVTDLWLSKKSLCVICNPITRRYVNLPELDKYKDSRSSLGFDPIDKQFKVLFMHNNGEWVHHVLTLGTEDLRWRKIQCPFTYGHFGLAKCINGVLYYLASTFGGSSGRIVCFDVRSEKFKFIDGKHFSSTSYTDLINYKGKLGGVNLDYDCDRSCYCEMYLWVLEDVEKQKWSRYDYSLPTTQTCHFRFDMHIAGMTATGEFVFAEFHTCSSKSFNVIYFNPEKNTLQSVNIQGLEGNNGYMYSRVNTFVDYIEDLSANDLKHITSKPRQRRDTSRELSRSAPSTKNKQTRSFLQNKYELLANLE
ncbi:putative F-box protein At5g38810 [Capsella rubella]|uniref:putative F-box protein At5g38810 n=1 Tax=Capsella rubella TaxID=81985 RepID=UPI000CD50BB5|nr:putative F-box protein At5g38810 [Capsella rubella]